MWDHISLFNRFSLITANLPPACQAVRWVAWHVPLTGASAGHQRSSAMKQFTPVNIAVHWHLGLALMADRFPIEKNYWKDHSKKMRDIQLRHFKENNLEIQCGLTNCRHIGQCSLTTWWRYKHMDDCAHSDNRTTYRPINTTRPSYQQLTRSLGAKEIWCEQEEGR